MTVDELEELLREVAREYDTPAPDALLKASLCTRLGRSTETMLGLIEEHRRMRELLAWFGAIEPAEPYVRDMYGEELCAKLAEAHALSKTEKPPAAG